MVLKFGTYCKLLRIKIISLLRENEAAPADGRPMKLEFGTDACRTAIDDRRFTFNISFIRTIT